MAQHRVTLASNKKGTPCVSRLCDLGDKTRRVLFDRCEGYGGVANLRVPIGGNRGCIGGHGVADDHSSTRGPAGVTNSALKPHGPCSNDDPVIGKLCRDLGLQIRSAGVADRQPRQPASRCGQSLRRMRRPGPLDERREHTIIGQDTGIGHSHLPPQIAPFQCNGTTRAGMMCHRRSQVICPTNPVRYPWRPRKPIKVEPTRI